MGVASRLADRLTRRPAGPEGYDRIPLGRGRALLQKQDGADALVPHEVEDGVWLLQQAGPEGRAVANIGPSDLGTTLLLPRRANRRRRQRMQVALGRFLCSEQTVALLRALEVDCVLDVGANVGQFAESLRSRGYTGRIVSFEPLSALAEVLRQKAAKDPDWLVFEYALGEEAGTAEINAAAGSVSSLLPASDFGKEWSAKLGDTHKETIQVRRLDSLWDEALAGLESPRIYLKLDTQGFDLHAFRGAGERRSEVVGMQSEIPCVPIYDGMPTMTEMLTEYTSAGLEIAGMYEVSRHLRSLRVIEFDVLFVRADEVRPPAQPGPE